MEDYILCLKCKPKLLLSHKSDLEAHFLHQLQNIDVHFVCFKGELGETTVTTALCSI